ncbi:ROK family protein [Sphingobacterium sp. SRCM116780]|uniref:ROK family protein n=1 Tax=Sphingobacterium sp. SRCM116780 TaxID=2907623 RepID=UPI001F15FBD0|nr:ROK family protein [Sphingobacterium sp. SRCM116780]UIR54561.1 ROK family protein [Sphingobacterium sp. SRCM116780]
MSENSEFILGVDIGGTHITAALVNQLHWEILSDNVVRNHVFSQENAKSIFHTWANTINACLNSVDFKVKHIGIAMPGPFDYENGISLMFGQSKYDELYKMDVKTPLSELTGIPTQNIHFINDAAAFLQGEVFAQNLNTKNNVLGITLGTGLGSAVWNNGDKSFDADLWNTPYQDSIFEEFLVTRWFIKRFKELTGIEVSGLKQIITEFQDHKAFPVICDEYGTNLVNFLKFFSEKYSCNEFIIGGNISKALPLFLDQKKNLIQDFHIYNATLGEEAAIIGAAAQFS